MSGIYRNKDVLLLISKDRELKELFRDILHFKKYPNVDFIVRKEYFKLPEHVCIKLIFLDITHLDGPKIVKTLSKVRERYIITPIFIITDSKGFSQCPIENLFNYGIKLVLQKPLRGVVIESIFYKNLAKLRDSRFDFKKYHGLILNEKHQYIIYNNCKVFLSEMECHLLSILMEEKSPLSCNKIQIALQNKMGKRPSENSVKVSIYRIRKKLKEGIGFKVIKCKYGVGYFIAV